MNSSDQRQRRALIPAWGQRPGVAPGWNGGGPFALTGKRLINPRCQFRSHLLENPASLPGTPMHTARAHPAARRGRSNAQRRAKSYCG